MSIVDSLPSPYQGVRAERLNYFVEKLNEGRFANEEGNIITFRPATVSAVGQQRGNTDCLIYALLNSFHIAKLGSLDAYQEVTSSLASGEMRGYQDLTLIGRHGRSATSASGVPVEGFMRSFRAKTLELIAIILQIQPEPAPVLPPSRSEESKNTKTSNTPALPKEEKSDVSPSVDYFQTFGDQVSIVSRKNCKLEGRVLGNCEFGQTEFTEYRSNASILPYQTEVWIESNFACREFQNQGKLSVQTFSGDGTLLQTSDLEYFRTGRYLLSTSNRASIGKIRIEPKSQIHFKANRFSENCEIKLSVILNRPAIQNRTELKDVKRTQKNRLQEVRDYVRSMELIHDAQSRLQECRQAMESSSRQCSEESVAWKQLSQLNLNKLDEYFDFAAASAANGNNFDREDFFESIRDILMKVRKSSQKGEDPRDAEVLTSTEKGKLNTLLSKMNEWGADQKIEKAKNELVHIENELRLTKKVLFPFQSPEASKNFYAREMQTHLDEMISGSEGILDRIQHRLQNEIGKRN